MKLPHSQNFNMKASMTWETRSRMVFTSRCTQMQFPALEPVQLTTP